MHPARTIVAPRPCNSLGWKRLRAGLAMILSTGAIAASAAPAFAASGSPSASPTSTGAGAAAPSPAAKTPTVTFGIGPTAALGSQERPYFSFGVTPGAEAADHVTLVNFSSESLKLTVYPVEADNTDTGAIGFLSATDKPVDIATWLSVGATHAVVVTVPGRPTSSTAPGHVTLPIKLTVPADAQPGDHVGGIVASLNVQSTKSNGEHVTLEQRVVSRVYVRVSGPLRPKLQIVGVHTSYHSKDATFGSGSMSVTYTVENTGNVRLAASQSVGVSGIFGGSKKINPGAIAQLLPGGSSTVSVIVPSVLPGILVRPHITLKPAALPGDVDPKLKPISYRSWVLAVPWGIVAVLGLLIIAFWWRRRGRAGPPAVAAASSTSPPDDSPYGRPAVARKSSKHGR
jgi:hypothetical protein